jgi:RNA-directed DNA polymerase
MYAPPGKQRVEDGIKSERRFVMNRIALQDLGHSERKLTYTHGLNLRRKANFMNKGEVNTERTANLDGAEISTKKATLQWEAIDWALVETFVNKAQARIAKATVKGDMKLVRELQRMFTHSYYAKLWAIRKVTSTKGKRTAGIDKEKWDSPAKKYKAVGKLEQSNYRAKALKRVYIPKSNGKMRPLSIPTMTDRAMQALEALALDPVIESSSDKHSFGFRKGRSCQDAQAQLFTALSANFNAEWIVEGDIKACFDEIAHEWLLEHTPMDKRILRQFLKAGYVYENQMFPTERGTPQGGIVSPILANHTLNGLDKLLGDNFKRKRCKVDGVSGQYSPKVNLVRYADDFVVTARTKEIAEQAKELIGKYIAERGLQLSEEKTAVTHISQGFDFLGWNFRKYQGKLLIKPSKKSQQKVLQKIREVIHKNISATQDNLIAQLNPIIDGWSNYHQGAVAKKAFMRIDHFTYLLLWKWARKRHRNKGRRWAKSRYWKTEGNSNWVFKDALTLHKMADKKIVRHISLKLDMNPYIDRDYFYFRNLKLLVNKRIGLKPKSIATPQTETGEGIAYSRLLEA